MSCKLYEPPERCPNCNRVLPKEAWRFCPYCGTCLTCK